MPPYDEGNREPSAPDGSAASIRMIEFGSDDKPDIWYKAEILSLENNNAAKALIEKFGLPKAILVNCPGQKEELRSLLGTWA